MGLLKMLDNRKYPRGEPFKILGVVNEPGVRAASKSDEYALWLAKQTEPEPAGIDEKVHDKPSGVLGYRLFPNLEFNDAARQKWDGDRFMNDPTCYNGFCFSTLMPTTLVAGRLHHTLMWDSTSWRGLLDTGRPHGPPFPRGLVHARRVGSGHAKCWRFDDAVYGAHHDGDHACAVTASSQVWNTT
jgi:hypothetical protein